MTAPELDTKVEYAIYHFTATDLSWECYDYTDSAEEAMEFIRKYYPLNDKSIFDGHHWAIVEETRHRKLISAFTGTRETKVNFVPLDIIEPIAV